MSTLEGQIRRVYAQYLEQSNDLRKWVYLANLRDRNEVLFYRLLTEHISEMLPVVYTPTVGLAIERFSQEFRRTRGVYLSVDHPEDVETALRNTGLGPNDVDLLVATDSEGILGIGDQGVGGIEISIGKLAVYTAAAGIHPRRVLPVVLDMGTDNLKLLNDDMYLGARHARIRDQRYDDLIDAYVTAVSKLFPDAMLHWEDFGATNARRILNKYADQVCTFNDDMQGTAAVVLAAVLAAVQVTGSQLRREGELTLNGNAAVVTGSGPVPVLDTQHRDGALVAYRIAVVERQGGPEWNGALGAPPSRQRIEGGRCRRRDGDGRRDGSGDRGFGGAGNCGRWCRGIADGDSGGRHICGDKFKSARAAAGGERGDTDKE